ncbi:MAG: hypothetical protein GY765_30575, partial [bacterium]|nr:hypothetical protein [bacterium]
IDRKALTQYPISKIQTPTGTSPQSEYETCIAKIWREVLGIEKIDIDDNYFEMGGNSLNIMRVNTKLQEALNKKISVATMFRFTTLRSLAQYLEQGETREHTTAGDIAESVELMEETLKITREEQAGPKNTTGTAIAVIGMAGRFPGAKNIDEFWENLKNGVESITFFTKEQLAEAGIQREMLDNPNYVRARGAIEETDSFDAAFFSYTPMEAGIMDPQIRIFHEITWEALENSGYDPYTYNGLIGLYTGAAIDPQWQVYTQLSGKNDQL